MTGNTDSTPFPSALLRDETSAPAFPHTPEPKTAHAPEPVSFSGTGAEYFGIWLVNLVLTIITLGVYSPWAKVRRLQYFYSNTWVAGANFAYHGTPKAILVGRAVGLLLLALYNFASTISVYLFALVLIGLALILPWLLRRSTIFRARNASYRSIRFRFLGTKANAYKTYLGWGIAMIVSLGLAAPAFAQRVRSYHFNDGLHLGTTPFRFTATARQFYGIWASAALAWLGFAFVLSIIFAVGAGVTGLATMTTVLPFVLLAAFWLSRAHYVARMQNLLWNHTTLGPHRFLSTAEVMPMFRIMLKNAVFTVLTLGLYRPYAVVHLTKYRLASLSILPGAALDEFLAQTERDASAIGEETADLFDLEISL